MKYLIEKNWYGLEYVTVKLPISRSSKEQGDLIHAKSIQAAELAVAREIITRTIPLRGVEIQYLRKTLGQSLREFASLLGVSHAAVAKWEKQPKKRLDPVNEVAVRTLCAQLLNLELRGWFQELVGTGKAQPIEFIAPAA